MPHATEKGTTTPEEQRDEWRTPHNLFQALHRRFAFTIDGAAKEGNQKLSRFFSGEPPPDGLAGVMSGNLGSALEVRWGNERVFCNPPYSLKHEFIRRWRTLKAGGLALFLLPADIVDQQDFHEEARFADEVWLLRGRVKFDGHVVGSPKFGSLILTYHGDKRLGDDIPHPRLRFYKWREDTLW